MDRKPITAGADLIKTPAEQQSEDRLQIAKRLAQILREAGYSCETEEIGKQ